ncbi:MAG: SPOR domain-containing protein [Gammaproteobacteria bacterium]|jgi:tetratricopeptide (TPR) repeat protein|nr:SPOR domain-containing protein [Gammaproteobacteria bacterium]
MRWNTTRKLAARAAVALALVLGSPGPVRADSFNAGVAAFQAGDYQAAWRMWLPLAEQGEPAAQFNIGLMLENSLGQPRDLGQAAAWYLKAARGGYADAAFNLGNLYLQGRGVPVSHGAAKHWWSIAAQAGHMEAQYNLGLTLAAEGQVEDGSFWLREASAQGHEAARAELVRLAKLPATAKKKPSGTPGVPSSGSPGHGNVWALQQPGDAYTVELFVSASLPEAQRFIRDHGITGAAVVIQTWSTNRYKVIGGSFSSRDAAASAIGRLGKDLRDQSPWARTFSKVQAEILPPRS